MWLRVAVPFRAALAELSHGVSAGPLPVAEAVSLLRDMARALAYAHAQGIVHREILASLLDAQGLARFLSRKTSA
jgi:hypothetical protein